MFPPLLFRFSHAVIGLAGLSVTSVAWAENPLEKNSLGMPLRLLEGGRFIMGTDARERGLSRDFPLSVNAQFFGNPEYPAHVTWITKPFWIGKEEVTIGQWKQFIAATGYVTTAEKSGEGIVGWSPTPEDLPLYQSHDFERKPEFTWKNPGFPQTENHPVVGVSFADVMAFLKWLSKKEGVTYRLPTEAEWEFACRAGTDTWFSFGDQARGEIHRHANIGNVELEKHRKHSVERQWLLDWENDPADPHVFTAPVGCFEPNPFSLNDLHGNVWEWCADLWLDTFYQRFDWPDRGMPRETAIDPVNESEPQTETNPFRTIRGGSWYNGPILCRSSNRTRWDENDAACYLGFRVVREADSKVSTTRVREALERELAAKALVEKAHGRFLASRGLNLEVRFEGESLSRDALKALASIPGIETLSLEQKEKTSLTMADLEAIAAIPSLKSLDFRSAFDLADADLGVLATLPQLTSLQFSRSTALNDTHFAQLSGLTTLTAFHCYGTRGGLTDAGIASLSKNRSLETLGIHEADATGAFLAAFAGAPLVELTLTSRSGAAPMLTDAQARRLESFPGLKHLSLNEQGLIGDSTVASLAKLEHLENLNLQGCTGISPNGFEPLGQLIRLRSLNLQATAAGDAAISALSGIPRIESLRVGSETLTDRGLADLSNLFSLQDLHIETCSATDAGVTHLGRINRLKRLDLGSPLITGTGLGPLARLPSLQDLTLRTPALTNVVFEQFARARSLRKLRLVERGWQPPAALTNEGLPAIASATWLTELWLPRNDTGLTEEGMEALQELMPKTNVIPYTVNWDKPRKNDD